MRETRAPLPLIFLIALTRGIAGAGLGLLLAEKLARKRRRQIGGVLLGIGALSTVPLLLNLFKRAENAEEIPTIANVPQSGVDPTEGLRAD